MSELRRGILLLLTVVLAWGLTWPIGKVVLASVPPLWAVALRSVIGTATLFAIAIARRQLQPPPRADLPVVLNIALLHMVGFGVLASIGLQLVPTGRSVVLAYTTPLWVTPGAALFLGERLTARRILGVALGLCGLAALFNPLAFDWTRREEVLGNAAILAAAFLWAASILHLRAHRWRSTPFALAPWEGLVATPVLVAISLAFEGVPEIAWTPSLVTMLLYTGIPGTALAYWAIAGASRSLPAVTTSLGLLATPVISIVVATLWLGEPLTLSLVAAVVLVLGGIALGAVPEGPTRPRTGPRRPFRRRYTSC